LKHYKNHNPVRQTTTYDPKEILWGGEQGQIQDFKLGGALKKLRRAEGGAKFFGVFRVKNHDFTPKNLIFSNFRGARAGCAPLDPPLLYLRVEGRVRIL
jgi:hypothetical protein